MPLQVTSDARWLRVQLLRCGVEADPTYSNLEMKGQPVGEPMRIERNRNGALTTVPVTIPPVPSGLYTARLDGPNGHLGFAPIIVRPATPSTRVAVVLPTTTWQAYNFSDENRDGFGDTWYALWSQRKIELTRPFLTKGIPYRFRSYDLAFLRWLTSRGHTVDMYADEDFERLGSASAVRAAYDLVVFPGHTEYATEALFDLVQRYRDLGGSLMFLSANNFFRRVDRSGRTARLVDEWRNLGRPESEVLGAQYIAGDRGQRQAPFVVIGGDVAPWAFEGTGFGNGSTFGVYGIEIDARSPASPPSTIVLAQIPNLFGVGKTAEMTYYETAAGSRVFSAGALNFGGGIMLSPAVGRLVDNVWARLTTPPV